MHDLIAIIGPTASGKTTLAAHLAYTIGGEVISADSRQVYRGMTIGTGKDLNDYIVQGTAVPYHLIDIVDAGYKYNVFEYQRDFLKAFHSIVQKGNIPIVCGGTGMYIEAILKGYELIQVPDNQKFRKSLEGKSLEELTAILQQYKPLHNTTDVDTVKRAVRAIEIADYYAHHPVEQSDYPVRFPLVTGLELEREKRRERITQRLKERLDAGMIEEVQGLLDSGIAPEELIYYGLEYKFITLYLTKMITFDELFVRLEAEIHRFAKRQMTWFRGMERRGIPIHWINALLPMEEKIDIIHTLFNSHN